MKRSILVILPAILAAFACLPAGAEEGCGLLAALDSAPAREVRIETRLTPTSSGQQATGTLSITARLADEWHIYSLSQPDGGPNPTSIVVDRSASYELAGPFVADRDPQQRYGQEFPGVPLQEHYGTITWSAPIRFAPGFDPNQIQITGTVTGIVSRDQPRGGTLSVNEKFRVSLAALQAAPVDAISPEFAEPASSEVTPAVFATPDSTTPVAEPAPAAAPATPAGPVVPTDVTVAPGPVETEYGHVTLSGEVAPGAVAPGGKAVLKVTFEMVEHFHIYPLAAWGERIPNVKPTLVIVTDPAGLKIGAPTTTSSLVEAPALVEGDPPQKFYGGKVAWNLEISVPADAAPGPHEIVGVIGFQACREKTLDAQGFCDLPSGALFKATVTVGAGRAGSAAVSFGNSNYPAAPRKPRPAVPPRAATPPPATGAQSPGSETPPPGGLEAAIAPAPAAPAIGEFTIIEANTLPTNSLAWILAGAFAGGFLLNLMPCVLPVIGLKLLSFAEQGGQSRGQVFALNLVYSLGLLSVFWVLAAMAIGLNMNWGAQFQSIWFNVLLTGMVFAMALSFLGVWEIPLPGFVGEKAGELSESSGYWGAFIKGAISTVVATPCSGPFLGAVFGATLGMTPPAIFLLFTFIGLGMAAPFLLVGALPDLIRFLPKPGEWMETFKKVMGFVMMGSVVLLISSIDKDYTIATLTLLVGLGLACWMIGRIGITAEWPETIQGWSYASAVAIIVGTLAFWQLGPNEAELAWTPFDSEAVAELQAGGKTVLIDFTAEWCPTCKWNLKTAINTRKVQELVKRNQIVPMIADMTSHDDEMNDFLRRLKARSIPVLAIFPANQPGQVIVLRDAVLESQVIHWLEQAGASQAGKTTVAMVQP